MIRAPEYFDLFSSISEGFQANSLMQFTQPRFTNYEKWVSKPPIKLIKSNLLLADFSKMQNISIDFRQFPSKVANNMQPMYQRRVQINQDLFRYTDVKSVSIGHLFKNDNLHRLMCSSLRKAVNVTELEIGAFDCERLHLLAKMLKHTKIQKLKIFIKENDLQSVKVKACLHKIRRYLRHLEVVHISSDFFVPHDGLRPFNFTDVLNILNGNQKFKEIALKPFADYPSSYQNDFFSSELEEKYNHITKLDLEYLLPYQHKLGQDENFHLPRELQIMSLLLHFRAADENEVNEAFKKLRNLIFKGCKGLETLKLKTKRTILDDDIRDPILEKVKLFPKLSVASQLKVLKLSLTSIHTVDLQGLQNLQQLEYLSIRLEDHIDTVVFPEQKLQTRVLKRLSLKIEQENNANKSQIEQTFLDFMQNNLIYSRDQITRISLEGFNAQGFNLLEFNFSALETLKLSLCLLTSENLKSLCSVASILPIKSLTLKDLTFEEKPNKQVFINRILREIAESQLGLKLEVLKIEKLPIDDGVDLDRKLTLQRMRCLRELHLKDLLWSEKGVSKAIENRMRELKKLVVFGAKYKDPMQIILLLIDYRRYYPSLETLGLDIDSSDTEQMLKAKPDASKFVNKFVQMYLKVLQNKDDSKLKLSK